MKNIICGILAALLISGSAWAHIGETREQCDARYGAPLSTADNGAVLYKKNGLVIAITFFENKADTVAYVHEEADRIGFHSEFSENEIQILQKANSDKNWVSISGNVGEHSWKTEDDTTGCLYLPMTKERAVIIATAEANKRLIEKKRDKEADKLKGL